MKMAKDLNKTQSEFSLEEGEFIPVCVDEQDFRHKDIVIDGVESKVFDFDAFLQLEGIGIKKYHDALYVGQHQDNKRHGQGIMKYSNGRLYEGEFNNDQRHGKGFERYKNGNTYFGEFRFGKADGKGLYKWINNEEYDGEWKDGLKHGNGMWRGS